ncbi:MAG: FecR family protein [Bacteroidota bacterium]
MKNFDNDTFLARWLNNELSAEEKAAFESSEEGKKYQKIIAGTDRFESPENFDPNEILGIVKESESPKINLQRRYWLYGIAAVIALLITTYFTFDIITYASYTSDYGEKRPLFLPDGTEVILNAKSKISFQRWNWKEERTVRLEGEAYFNVIKGSTFTVEADHGTVTVLGTRFNVKSAFDFIEVVCYEGKVRVNTLAHNKILNPTEGFRQIYSDTTLLTSTIAKPTWMNNESSFDNMPAQYVLDELGNQYDLYFEGRLPEDLMFTGSFPHNNKDLALKIVLGALQINYNVKENIVELQSK